MALKNIIFDNSVKIGGGNLLQEVCLLRLLLIVLLVLYHSFAPFCGAWKPLETESTFSHLYYWIGKTSYSFMLETFTFVSGYVFGYQIIKRGKQYITWNNIINRKLKRLIVPSIVFSVIYLLLFTPMDLITSPMNALIRIFSGVGHMWYLPMLFWCFVGIFIIEKKGISHKLAISLLLLMSIISFLPLPLGLGSAMYYMVYFFAGYIIAYRVNVLKYAKPTILICGWIAFIIIFIFSTNVSSIVSDALPNQNLIVKIKGNIILNLLRLSYSSVGVMAVFLTAVRLIKVEKISLSPFLIQLSTYCFGIYIFQQFILQYIYYHTELASITGADALPWIAFIFTLVVSYYLTHLMLKTKIGRNLIG